jgi:hypothetical protein
VKRLTDAHLRVANDYITDSMATCTKEQIKHATPYYDRLFGTMRGNLAQAQRIIDRILNEEDES